MAKLGKRACADGGARPVPMSLERPLLGTLTLLFSPAQSKLMISTQFEPLPVGYFCNSLSAPLVPSISQTEIVSDFSPLTTM
jgi:hypothetical protein